MIDLTPLDVRKKKGDFRRAVRGYEPQVVDDFLDLAAERLEELVRENTALRERVSVLSEAIGAYRERERAMNEALVSAQQLREDMRTQSARDAEVAIREARIESDRLLAHARDEARSVYEATERIQTQRAWFLRSFRAMVERQLGEIEQEEERLRELKDMMPESPLDPHPAAGDVQPDAEYAEFEEQSAEDDESGAAPWLATIDGDDESEDR